MTRAQRRPNNTQRCLEWAEYLFWFIPIAVVAALVFVQAVAIHLFLRITRWLWRREPEPILAPIHTVATVPSPSLRSRKSLAAYDRAHSLCPTSTFPVMLKRSGKGRFSHVAPPHLLSCDHACGQNLSVPRFPGAKIPGGSNSKRF